MTDSKKTSEKVYCYDCKYLKDYGFNRQLCLKEYFYEDNPFSKVKIYTHIAKRNTNNDCTDYKPGFISRAIDWIKTRRGKL